MPEPLPVEVVSDWWDYFVDVVGVVSGLATAGALLIAALAYRRQIDEAILQQAKKVIVTIAKQENTGKSTIFGGRSSSNRRD